jgi:hypothetical protein
MNRSDSDSETEDSTLPSGRGQPRLDEHGKSEAIKPKRSAAAAELRSGAFVLGGRGRGSLFYCLAGLTTTGRNEGVAPTAPLKRFQKENLLQALQALQKSVQPV